jgi:hypothetical protein
MIQMNKCNFNEFFTVPQDSEKRNNKYQMTILKSDCNETDTNFDFSSNNFFTAELNSSVSHEAFNAKQSVK